MTPLLSSNYIAGICFGNMETIGYFKIGKSHRSQFSHLYNYIFGEFSERIIAAPLSVFPGLVIPSLCNRIKCVVSWGSKKQVIWVHARRIITSMADKKTWRNWPVNQFVANAMREIENTFTLSKSYFSISKRRFRTQPYPATRGLINVRPEPINLFWRNVHVFIIGYCTGICQGVITQVLYREGGLLRCHIEVGPLPAVKV